MLESQSQLQVLRQRCDASDRDILAKAAEATSARSLFSDRESEMNTLRRQLESSQLQLQISQQNEIAMKSQLDSERKLHLSDAQAAEELKQFTKKVYGVLKEGALMLDKVRALIFFCVSETLFVMQCAGTAFSRSGLPPREIRH
jgi:hypothetical protein